MAQNLTSIVYKSIKADGTPNALGKVYTYAAGGLTPLDSYTTQAGDVANTSGLALARAIHEARTMRTHFNVW